MNKTLINTLIITFIGLIFFFILMFLGNSVSLKFEIDEWYSHGGIETNKIILRERQLIIYQILNGIGICFSILSIIYLSKKKRQLK